MNQLFGEQVSFDGSAKANVAAGDAFAARMRAMVDEIIRRRGLDAPPAEQDDNDMPVDLDSPASLDLRAEEVGAVVWCTGFTGDFSFLGPALVDIDGQPRHNDGAAPAPRPLVRRVTLAHPAPIQPPVRLPRRRRHRHRRGQDPSGQLTA
jgi:hypothetical protein